MSKPDSYFEPASIRGNVDLPLLLNPTIRGGIRRSDPDGSHNQAYFPSLAGTSLTLTFGVFGGASTPLTINFATNNYSDAVAAVNAISPANIAWVESDGFACIQNLNGGGKNYLKITGGTAAPVLGIPVDPLPGSYSQAGDLAASQGDKKQSNPNTTELLAHDENLSTTGINRAIYGSLMGVFQKLRDLDREFVIYKLLPATQFASGGAIPSNTVKLTTPGTDGLNRISVSALKDAVAKQQAIAILSNAGYPIPLYDASGNVINVLGVSYGPSDTANETNQSITWGTPPANPGADLTGALAAPSFKAALTNIVSIRGNVIKATGALFVTNRVQKHDVVTIQGATNNTPFNHNGEFAVVDVFDENNISIRALGPNESLVVGSEDKPLYLNQVIGGGSYGQIGVYVGPSVTMAGKAASGNDQIFFRLSATLNSGTTVKLRVPVTTTLRECLAEAFLDNTAFDQDPNIAYQTKANIFQRVQEFQKAITLDELDGIGVTPRINAPALSATAGYNLLLESKGVDQGGSTFMYTRVYVVSTAGISGGILITTNAKLNSSGQWVKDISGQGAWRFLWFNGALFMGGRLPGSNTNWTDSGWDQTQLASFDPLTPLFTIVANLTMTGSITVNGVGTLTNGFDIGSGLRNTGTGVASLVQAAAPRIFSTLPNSITGDTTQVLTLAMKWTVPTGSIYRLYISQLARGFRLTINALWNGDATGWTSDDTAVDSYSYLIGSHFRAKRKAATAGAWADTAWDATPVDLDMTATGNPININSFFDMPEIADPVAPAAAHARLYVRSNGAVSPNHRTQLMAIWPDGTTSIIAESPLS